MNNEIKPLKGDLLGNKILPKTSSDAVIMTDGRTLTDTIESFGSESFSGETCINVTYSDLVSLRENDELIPGMHYRITDYQCTTTQENTQSAGHQFDIIVVADSESVLNEVARVALHEGDDYFLDNNLAAWEIKYCLSNDVNRFAWADETNGKGVIYWMKDEFDNECPYDFKNIQFKRYKITEIDPQIPVTGLINKYLGIESNYSGKISVDTNDFIWCYTFTSNCDNNEQQDISLNKSSNVHNNIINAYYVNTLLRLNNNVISCGLNYNNIFVGDCINNTIVSGCCSNTFECGSSNNIIWSSSSNTFGNYSSSNVLGGSSNNTFGKYSSSNVLGGSSNNTFGKYSSSNVLGGSSNNTFGNYSSSNVLGGSSNNTFGNYSSSNILYSSSNNTFGRYCVNNTFDSNCNNNTFADICSNNTFGSFYNCNTFGTNCGYNTFGSNCNGITFGSNCYNNTFGNDCYYNTFGNDCYYNTFGNDCDNNTFGNNCVYNTFGWTDNMSSGNLKWEKTQLHIQNNYQYIKFEDNVSGICLTTNNHENTTTYKQHITLRSVMNYPTWNLLDLQLDTLNQSYEIIYDKTSSGEVIHYCLADLLNKALYIDTVN